MNDSTYPASKISLLGNQGVGKTSIRNVYLGDEFSDDMLLSMGNNKENKIVEFK